MNRFAVAGRTPRSRSRGLNLIELMIAMVIGLLIVGAALGVFASNGAVVRATQSLGRVQETARIAFEFISQDIRVAGSNPCGRNLPVANTLNTPTANWYTDWSVPVTGYENGALAGSVAGSDAIDLRTTEPTSVSVVNQPSATSANFTINTANSGFQVGDILMVCDYKQAAIIQMTGPAAGPGANARTIVHNTGSGTTPGNCTVGMGYRPVMDCSANGTPYIYQAPSAVIARTYAARWYVAENGRGGRSLYRLTSRAPTVPEEVAEGVRDMQLEYLVRGASSYANASAVTALQWPDVVAVRLTLTLEGQERVGTGGQALQRTLTSTITLRSRSA